jgi:hypothetical protein
MFEAEVEMEKRSSFGPLLLVLALLGTIVGLVTYIFMQTRQHLAPAEAGQVVSAILKSQGPASVQFHGGLVVPSVNERPGDPHYRLLEKAGLVKIGKQQGRATPIMVSAVALHEFQAIPEFRQWKDKDGTDVYFVPLAERKLGEISKITMKSPTIAVVNYTWKWEPNKIGEIFDASGSTVKSFNTWDRATLIQKYGANFYHGEPNKETVTLVRGDKGWQVAAE